MSLVRWEPLSEIDTLFNRMLPSMFARWPRVYAEGNGGTKFEWSPSADIIWFL